MHPLIWLFVQVAAASASAWLMLRHALPGIAALRAARHPDTASMVSTWLAIAVAMPTVIVGSLLGRGEIAAGHIAGAAASTTAAAGLVALGVAILAGAHRPHDDDGAVDRTTWAAAVAAATLMAVLCIERHLTVWTGQTAFALLAVMLWLGGPPRRRPEDAGVAIDRATQRRELATGFALIGVTACGIVEGVAARAMILASAGATDGSAIDASTTLALAAVIVLGVRVLGLSAAAGTLPGPLGRRAAVWTMAVGLLGATGTAALVRLPGLVGIAATGEPLPGTILGGGFGAWAAPAACAAAVVAGLGLRDRGTAGRAAGVIAVVAGVTAFLGQL